MSRSHDDSGAVGELSEQSRRVLEHPFQFAVGLGEKDLHLLVLGLSEGMGAAEVVDEEAVTLVGGDTPGARVGVGQVPLAFECRHVGADRSRARPLSGRRVRLERTQPAERSRRIR